MLSTFHFHPDTRGVYICCLPMRPNKALLLLLLLGLTAALQASDKPKLTLDEFFNFIYYPSVHISPRRTICRHRRGTSRLGPEHLPR